MLCEKCLGPTFLMEKDGLNYVMPRCRKCKPEAEYVDEGYVALRFHKECPPLFRLTDTMRLPEKMRRAANEWAPHGEMHSLLLHGTTGNGKTRTAWVIANRLWASHLSRGVPYAISFKTMSKFTDDITSSFAEDKGHERLMEHLQTADLLVLDDLGKEKMTPRVSADLFAVVDGRANMVRPTIVTTNFNGAGLTARFEDPEMGVAFVRRLRDYYLAVGS